MAARSFTALRPKLDGFFDAVRRSLESREAAGVDRGRLEEFLTQTQRLQERLYACLESNDRSDLPLILKDLQVMAYRTRVLFGSPLPGVAWDDLQLLFAGMSPSPPAEKGSGAGVLEAPRAAWADSTDLKDALRNARVGPRVLVAPTPTGLGGGDLVSRPPEPAPSVTLEGSATRPLPDVAPAPADALPAVAAPDASESAPPEPALPEVAPPELALPEDAPAEAALPEPPVAVSPVGAADLAALPLGIPFLMGTLVFLAGAIAGYSLGGTHPSLTALATGIAASLAYRTGPRSLRYNDEAPEASATSDGSVRRP